MIERIIEFSIRNRWLVIAAGLLLALAGIQAVYSTPVDAIPDLSENQVIVFTDWTGHSPQEIEDQVTYPLSLQLQGIAGVRVVRSSSDFNFSMISIIFEDGVSWAAARDQVARHLASARDVLPPSATPALPRMLLPRVRSSGTPSKEQATTSLAYAPSRTGTFARC